jgi:hypothetical protein
MAATFSSGSNPYVFGCPAKRAETSVLVIRINIEKEIREYVSGR